MKKSPLATLLRVRRIQEEIARSEVIAAQALAVFAEENEAARQAAVNRHGPTDGNPRIFMAGVIAGRSLAADAFAARRATVEAHGEVGGRMQTWAGAASRAEGVERVVTRHEAEARAAAEAADAVERDDLASVGWRRRAAMRTEDQ